MLALGGTMTAGRTLRAQQNSASHRFFKRQIA